MFRPTTDLRADHRVIAEAMNVLTAIGREVGAGRPLPVGDCAAVIQFLREFLIGVHFQKEASCLLPAFAMHGDERRAEQMGDLLRLHEEVVALTHSLMMFWEPEPELSAAEQEGFAETVAALTALVRRLQAIEEGELFAACELEVPPDDRMEWREQFASLERGRASRDQWRSRLRDLAARWR
jgi:hemerythrin-like domain-containing protein